MSSQQQQLDSNREGEQLLSRDRPDLEHKEEAEEEGDDGRLMAARLLLGTKILVEREAGSCRLLPAVISGHDGDRVAVTWKDQQQPATATFYEPEDLVRSGVLDLAALSSDRLRSGSRVAVFPFPEAVHLVPGLVRNRPRYHNRMTVEYKAISLTFLEMKPLLN
jgi:hypothetical protein